MNPDQAAENRDEAADVPGKSEPRFSRRGSLVRMAGLVATASTGGALRADAAGAAEVGPAAVASGAVKCVLTPELTEGPFYIPNEAVRKNIAHGKPGAPLELQLTVVSASTCRPIEGAAVDIWHCDAAGVYSGYGSASRGGPPTGAPGGHAIPTDKLTFLRGIQKTDSDGLAIFSTIYPGWYPGRAVHIHVKVHLGGKVVHTGQLFFPERFTDQVYRDEPYASRPDRDTRDKNDSVFVNGGAKGMLVMAMTVGQGYSGSITMGVVTK